MISYQLCKDLGEELFMKEEHAQRAPPGINFVYLEDSKKATMASG